MNFIGFFDDKMSFDKYETCIIIYNRCDYKSVLDKFHEFKNDLDYWFSINWDGKFYDILVFYKNEISYTPIYLLRDVNTPFKVMNEKTGKSEARGWFYNELGKPVRYTGLGNSLYFSKSKNDIDFSEKAMYIFNFSFFNNNMADSNIKSYENMLKNKEFYLNNDCISSVQDNGPHTYENKGFHFGIN